MSERPIHPDEQAAGAAALRDANRLPPSLTGAAMAAFVALIFTAGWSPILPIFAVLMVTAHFTTWRLPASGVLIWGLRSAVILLIISSVGLPTKADYNYWYFEPHYTNLFGYICAAELTLRAWHPGHALIPRIREWRGVVVLLTALVMGAATNTYDRPHIEYTAPLYTLLLILSMRTFAKMDQPRQSESSRHPFRPALFALRTVVVLLALSIGFSGVYVVTHYENRLTNWAIQSFRRQNETQTEIGFSTSPQLAAVFNPEPSITRVLQIDGPTAERYLRVMAFDTLANSEWHPTLAERSFQAADLSRISVPDAVQQLHFTPELDTLGLLPIPLEAAEVSTDSLLQQDSAASLQDRSAAIASPYDATFSSHENFQGPLCQKPDPRQLARLTAIPDGIDPKVVDLARSVAGNASPAERIHRLVRYLHTHHRYSLEYQPQGQPLNDFILNDRDAHCQYFASAMVVMSRAAGVPARYITGFYGHETYGNNQMVVRQRDAHAWAECWIDGIGWTTVDATPEGGLPASLFPNPPKWRRWWERIIDFPGNVRDWLAQSRQAIMVCSSIGCALTLTFWFIQQAWIRRRKRSASTVAYKQVDPKLIALVQQFEAWLRAQQIPCPPDLTWREHLSSLKTQPARPINLNQCHLFINLYDHARFGGANGDTAARMKALLDSL